MDLDQAQVVVLVPRTVSGNDMDEAADGVNQCADHCTSPKYAGNLNENEVHLWTYYVHIMDLNVGDQFGNQLAIFYDGAEVTEGNLKIAINQQIHSGGHYEDPVGVQYPRLPNADFEYDSATAIEWCKAKEAKMAMTNEDFIQEIPVQIGGHELAPAIKRRIITTASTNNIEIIWQS